MGFVPAELEDLVCDGRTENLMRKRLDTRPPTRNVA